MTRFELAKYSAVISALCTFFSAVIFIEAQTLGHVAATPAQKEYKRLLELKGALERIPYDGYEKEPHKSFLKKNENDIVYSDPSGEYYVRSERFWDLSRKYKALTLADEIAWTAAQNPEPGECEGYVNCYVYHIRSTMGQYLEMFPKGKFAGEALSEIGGQMDTLAADKQSDGGYEWPSEREDIADLRKLLDELNSLVSRTLTPLTQPVSEKIKKVKGLLK